MTNNYYRNLPDMPNKQQGVVLIIALIMLLLMSIIGITAQSTNILEERMTANLKDKNISFQSGEAALREMEAKLTQLTADPVTVDSLADCSTPPCYMFNAQASNPSGPPLPDLTQQSHAWWQANGTEYGAAGGDDLEGVANDPRYVSELIKFSTDDLEGETAAQGKGVFYYRVTARGTGGSDESQSIVQVTFRKRYN